MRPAHGRPRDLMQIAAAVVGSAAAAQVIAPPQHIEVDFGNGEGEDWWAVSAEVSNDGHTLVMRSGYGPGGAAFQEAQVHLSDGTTWQVVEP